MLPREDRGSGEVVLLLHAGIADRTMWREHVDWLAEAGFRPVAPDLPGFGEAPVGPGPQAPWEDALGVLRELGVNRATVVGNSFGAAVALRVAAVAPSAIAALMLVSPPPLDDEPSPALSAAWDAEEAALARGDIDGAVAAVLDSWLQPDASTSLRTRVATMQRRAFELQAAAPEPAEAPDPLQEHPEVLAGLQMPVLAAAGAADLPDFGRGAAEIAARVAHGQTAVIEGAGHLAPLEAPAEFRRLLLAFLRHNQL